MTPTTKAVKRLTSDVSRRGLRTVVRLGPGDLIAFKEFGRRTWYETTVGACKAMAVRQFANAALAEKEAKRIARGGKPKKFLRKSVML